MSLSAVGLLAGAQQASLAFLGEVLNQDFMGLSVAARAARRAGLLSSQEARRLVRLDEAAHVARHATSPRMEALLTGMRESVRANLAAKGGKQQAAARQQKQVVYAALGSRSSKWEGSASSRNGRVLPEKVSSSRREGHSRRSGQSRRE